MLYVTLTLTENEWQRINSAAQNYWPGVQLDRTLSRNECVCRLLFGRYVRDALADIVKDQDLSRYIL